MAEIEAYPIEQPRKLYFNWVLPVFWRPRRSLARVVESHQPVWLTPLLILTMAAIVYVLVAAPIQKQASMMTPVEPPPDFQYWTPEQQTQYQETMAAQSGPLFTYGFPTLGALAKVWLGWLLLGGVLHLVLTLSGGRSSLTTVMNIVAWASVPILLRYVVQIISMLAAHRLIANPGLSGFAPAEASGVVRYFAALLPSIDLYFLWQVALIVVGLRTISGLSLGKVWVSVLIAVVIVLALGALPGFLGAQFSGLSMSRPFYF